MSTRQTPGTDLFTQGGDLGLGFCYSCLTDYHASQSASRPLAPPRFAITYAPAAIPGPTGGLYLIPLPSCWNHLVPNREHTRNGGSGQLIRPR